MEPQPRAPRIAPDLLAGRVALVTGASKGIGRALALGLAQAGAQVALNYKTDAAGAQSLRRAIEDRGGTAVTLPADVGVSDNAARLVDAARVTSTGMMVGTASYLAPEQVEGEPVGPPADVYALGLVLLECLTGEREYAGGTVEVALARLHRQPSVPADLLARRADIAAAQARIEAAEAGRLVARRNFYPNVDLTALAGLQAIGVGNLFSLDAGMVGAGPAIHLPIFEGGKLKAQYRGATADLDNAVADYDGAVLGAVRDAAAVAGRGAPVRRA